MSPEWVEMWLEPNTPEHCQSSEWWWSPATGSKQSETHLQWFGSSCSLQALRVLNSKGLVSLLHCLFFRSVKLFPRSPTWISSTWAPTRWREWPWSRGVLKPFPECDDSSSTTLKCPGTPCCCSSGRYLSKKDMCSGRLLLGGFKEEKAQKRRIQICDL